MSDMSADLLVYDLHGQLMRQLTPQLHAPAEGLAQVARQLRRRGILTNRLAKKLERVDIAYHINRHASKYKFDNFVKQVASGIKGEHGKEGEQTDSCESRQLSSHEFVDQIKQGAHDNSDNVMEVLSRIQHSHEQLAKEVVGMKEAFAVMQGQCVGMGGAAFQCGFFGGAPFQFAPAPVLPTSPPQSMWWPPAAASGVEIKNFGDSPHNAKHTSETAPGATDGSEKMEGCSPELGLALEDRLTDLKSILYDVRADILGLSQRAAYSMEAEVRKQGAEVYAEDREVQVQQTTQDFATETCAVSSPSFLHHYVKIEEHGKLAQLAKIRKAVPGSHIIFAKTARRAEALYKLFKDHGLSVFCNSKGTTVDDQEEEWRQFDDHKTGILVTDFSQAPVQFEKPPDLVIYFDMPLDVGSAWQKVEPKASQVKNEVVVYFVTTSEDSEVFHRIQSSSEANLVALPECLADLC